MVIIPVILGAGFGLGMWVCVRALRPRPQPIADVLAGLDQPRRALDDTPAAARPSVADRAGQAARRIVEPLGLDDQRQADLALVGRTPERHALGQLAAGLAGLLATSTIVVGLTSTGLMHIPAFYAFLFCAVAGVGGWFLPVLSLRDQAQRQRRAFRHALSGYLDLVNVLLAGGAGIETSLWAAADVGEGWGFDRIRHSLQRARLTSQSPWETFATLGKDLGVSELSELAANVALAGSHGTRIRASLAAQADALRGRQVAETESAAESATERMVIPVTVLLAGFLIVVAYPALRIVTGVA